jgi:hypothetical protein
MHGQAKLPQMVLARHPSGCLARHLNRRKQQRDQHTDDGDHHQQLDQSQPSSSLGV